MTFLPHSFSFSQHKSLQLLASTIPYVYEHEERTKEKAGMSALIIHKAKDYWEQCPIT